MRTGDFEMGAPRFTGDRVELPVEVPHDLRTLEGHFPGDPIVPGVAQLLLVARAVREVWPEAGVPRGVERLKFRRRIGPGDRLSLVLAREGGKVRFTVRRADDDDECTRGALLLAQPSPSERR